VLIVVKSSGDATWMGVTSSCWSPSKLLNSFGTLLSFTVNYLP